ncbi:unnamed protein product [Hymenolepis diminuta]|uniref:Uncharacterized protein n=1 Tax=Hymenolepis diminuta TaxID=6216 RepID=A0A564XUS9_HYMDI|nr:unnamed protein product [Hymenolepis diminuta]VUZ38720.1 unnamed protein product [Hymenolepis diminuta]
MDKKLEMEIERITSALKYSDYCSLNEFLERLKGYEKGLSNCRVVYEGELTIHYNTSFS